MIGRNVQFLVEVENKKESVHATPLLQRMAAMTAQLTDQAVLKPENVTKISVQVSDFEINEYFHYNTFSINEQAYVMIIYFISSQASSW